MTKTTAGNLKVEIYETRGELGKEAAAQAGETIKQLLNEKDEVNIIFAAAPSQNEFLDALVVYPGIAWNRVNAFDMDEYIGLPENHAQRFGNYLRKRFFDHVTLKSLNLINEGNRDEKTEAGRYAALLKEFPIDITFMGVGENTHLAFNDPHVADFNDPQAVKIVDIDQPCKQQQVNDGCFASLEEVPSFAYTLTIPTLLNSRYIFCMVPAKTKAPAVKHTLLSDISETYPSTSLRNHPNATIYLDHDSASIYLQSEMATQ